MATCELVSLIKLSMSTQGLGNDSFEDYEAKIKNTNNFIVKVHRLKKITSNYLPFNSNV